MRFDNMETEMFMLMLGSIVSDENTYLLSTERYYAVDPHKTLLGYYDKYNIYLIPSVIIGLCDDYMTSRRLDPLNMQLILNTLFRANLIKVGWVMRKDVRYRPEKRIGGKRRRYITFIRKEIQRRKESIDA